MNMDDVKKGTVTAVLATVVTSAMILMSSEGNADNTELTAAKAQSSKVETGLSLQEKNVEVTDSVIDTHVHKQSIENNLGTKVRAKAHSAPPGPFEKTLNATADKPQTPYASKSPIYPEPPKNGLNKATQKMNQQIATTVTQNANKVVTAPKVADVSKTISTGPFNATTPSLHTGSSTKYQKPSTTTVTKLQATNVPALANANTMQKNSSQPIWMQGNNMMGVINSPQHANKGMARFNQGNPKPMTNAYGVRYMQQYIYVPVPVYPSYHYPQIPMNNDGYYSTPMPNYWTQRGIRIPKPQQRMNMNPVPQESGEN